MEEKTSHMLIFYWTGGVLGSGSFRGSMQCLAEGSLLYFICVYLGNALQCIGQLSVLVVCIASTYPCVTEDASLHRGVFF